MQLGLYRGFLKNMKNMYGGATVLILGGIVINLVLMIRAVVATEMRRTPNKYLRNLLGLLLLVVMANHLYKWDVVIIYFPILKVFTKEMVMYFCIATCLICMLFWGIFQIIKYEKKGSVNGRLDSEKSDVKSVDADLDENKDTKMFAKENGIESVSVMQILGYAVSAVAVLALVIVLCYLAITNEMVFEKLSTDITQNMIHLILQLFVFLALVALAIWTVFIFVKQLSNIVRTKKIDTTDNSLLKLISVAILAVFYYKLSGFDLNQWFGFMAEPNELGPALMGSIMIVFAIIFSYVIYRLLQAFANPASELRKHINEISHMLFDIGAKTIKNLLEFANFIPDFLTWAKYLLGLDKVKKVKKKNSLWKFLNVCAVLLAMVSFFTTAEGMKKFFFYDTPVYAYMISAGIQGILLGLNMKLPYHMSKKPKAVKTCILSLYAFCIMLSSGFSYIYISNAIYNGSWMNDAQIQLRRNYQEVKTSLLQKSSACVNEKTSEVLTGLQEFASTVDEGGYGTHAEVSINIEQYKVYFQDDEELLSIVNHLENENYSSGDHAKLLEILNEKREYLENSLSSLEYEIGQTKEQRQVKVNERLNLIRERNSVPEDSDTYNSFTKAIEDAEEALKAYDSELNPLKEQKEKEGGVLEGVKALSTLFAARDNADMTKVEQLIAVIETQLGSANPQLDIVIESADKIYSIVAAKAEKGGAEQLSNYIEIQNQLTEFTSVRGIQARLTNGDDFLKQTEALVVSYPDAERIDAWRTLWKEPISMLTTSLMELPQNSDFFNIDQNIREHMIESLTTLQRNYLTDINDVEKAKLYLTGPYPVLAWCALFVSAFLDISPMFLGIFKYYNQLGGTGSSTAGQKKRSFKTALAGTVLLVCGMIFLFLI